MNTSQQESNGETRLAYILGVPLAENVVRQWPQMGEIVRTSRLIAEVEGNFPELTLEIGRRLHLDDAVVVEWSCDYGDGRLFARGGAPSHRSATRWCRGRSSRLSLAWRGRTATARPHRRLTDTSPRPPKRFSRIPRYL